MRPRVCCRFRVDHFPLCWFAVEPILDLLPAIFGRSLNSFAPVSEEALEAPGAACGGGHPQFRITGLTRQDPLHEEFAPRPQAAIRSRSPFCPWRAGRLPDMPGQARTRPGRAQVRIYRLGRVPCLRSAPASRRTFPQRPLVRNKIAWVSPADCLSVRIFDIPQKCLTPSFPPETLSFSGRLSALRREVFDDAAQRFARRQI